MKSLSRLALDDPAFLNKRDILYEKQRRVLGAAALFHLRKANHSQQFRLISKMYQKSGSIPVNLVEKSILQSFLKILMANKNK